MKLIIKETSIKGEKNARIFGLLQEEICKYVDGLKFEMAFQNGNVASAESTDYNDSSYKMAPDNFKKYVNETLNFRYENFTIIFA